MLTAIYQKKIFLNNLPKITLSVISLSDFINSFEYTIVYIYIYNKRAFKITVKYEINKYIFSNLTDI